MSARVLVLAGKDPTGGAGVDADLEALAAAGCTGDAVVTNETDQDGVRVRSVRAVPAATWTKAARERFGPRTLAIKTGLVSSAEQVRALGGLVEELRVASGRELAVVVDPVLAASGGEVFLDEEGRGALLLALRSFDAILTPNLPEAAALVGAALEELVSDVDARERVAAQLLDLGARAVVLKGGHGNEDPVVDLVVERSASGAPTSTRLLRPRIRGAAIHGSGCRFASFLAGRVALGDPLAEAVRRAGAYLGGLLATTRSR
ncbi:MAG: bifunctional hydroxymethylpyrimidine kinase/phosphomethylpyrimidine kinase [Planctomycetota bacterium]